MNPDGEPSSKNGLDKWRMSVRPHKNKHAPDLPGRYYKFKLEKPRVDFLVPDPAAKTSNQEPYILMHMRKKTRVAYPEPTTAVHIEPTPADASPAGDFTAGSASTPERPASPDGEVTGRIERLHLTRADSNAEGAASADGAGETLVERALVLKTDGNKHFSAGEYFRALTLYSEAFTLNPKPRTRNTTPHAVNPQPET